MKIVVRHLASNLPGGGPEERAMLRAALEQVARRAVAAGGPGARASLARVAVDLGQAPSAGALRDGSAARAVAEQVCRTLEPQLAGVTDPTPVTRSVPAPVLGPLEITLSGSGQRRYLQTTRDLLAAAEGGVEFARIHYGRRQIETSSSGAIKPAPYKPKLAHPVASGAGQGKPIGRPAKEDAELTAAIAGITSEFQSLWSEVPYLAGDEAKAKVADFAQVISRHLTRIGVEHTLEGLRIVVAPVRGKSRLNEVAEGLKRRYGTILMFDLHARMIDKSMREALGYHDASQHALQTDLDSLMSGKVTTTMLHEIHHVSEHYKTTRDGVSSFTSLSVSAHARYALPSGGGFYDTYMSLEELSTWTREIRQEVSERVPKNGGVYTSAAHRAFREQLSGLRALIGNTLAVTQRMRPLLTKWAEGGGEADPETSPFTAKGERATANFNASAGFWKLQTLQTPEQVAAGAEAPGKESVAKFWRMGKDKKARLAWEQRWRRETAKVMLGHVEVAEKVAETLSHLVAGIEQELAQLRPDEDVLTPEGARALRDLTSWLGYIVRVANPKSPEQFGNMQERLQELDRQLAGAKAFHDSVRGAA